MKKLFILTVIGLIASFSSFAQLLPIYAPAGSMSSCIGATTFLTENDSLPGGTWTSSNTAIASVSLTLSSFSGTATVTGISAGVATITYTLSGSYVTASFTVSATPAGITGATPTCVGASAALSDATPGGAWSTGDAAIASVGAATGVVTGVHGGTTNILYTVGAGCPASIAVTIATLPDDSISGPSTVCAGSAITLTDATTGGTWASASTAIATVSAAGVVSGVSAGTTNITYTLTTGCAGTGSTTQRITVGGTTSAGTISGASSVAVGAPITLSDGSGGGTWSSSNTAVATVSASAGVVTGVTPGTTIITYTVSGCTGVASTTTNVTVTAFTGISGYVSGTSCSGGVKVWLITYNPATLNLAAVDSATFSGGADVYYQFTGLSADSFRVKAANWDASVDTLVWGRTCGVPTYHTSSLYWHDADVIYYTSGAADINENINLVTGTLATGPGFIGGNVMSGANRGTLTTVPAVGLVIFLQNSATGAMVQQTVTDAGGNYTFSSLPYGTYFVYPELINYTTTPYTSITISAATPSVTSASFVEHTLSKTITPVNEAVNNMQPSAASVVTYPNPAGNILNILWNTAANETGNVSITDITGREVYKAAVKMNAGTGTHQADLSGLANGLYLISVKSANISYNNKIEVQH